MKFFKPIKQNEIKETRSEIHQKITSNDLKEQHRKALNKYRRYLKEYDEEQTPEKYKELIQVHTELKEIETQIQNLGTASNELTNDDFNVKSEDINIQNEGTIPTITPNIIEPISNEQEKSYQDGEFGYKEQAESKEEMITGDDGITRPKSLHDQIESNKCLFCEEKFGFTQDWNVHMMYEHPQELVEYNKKEIEKLASKNENVKEIVDMINLGEVIFEENEKLEHENQQNTNPDPQMIDNEMVGNEISKDECEEIVSTSETTQSIKEEMDENAKKLLHKEKVSKPVIPTESIIDLNEIIPNKQEKKIKFNISGIFKHKKFSKLKGIEAYCNVCKHTVQQHEYLGKSEGCVKCGCLKTVQEILEINEVDLKYGEEKPLLDNGIYCVCGHSQLTHKDHAKFCEVEDCHCVRFRTK